MSNERPHPNSADYHGLKVLGIGDACHRDELDRLAVTVDRLTVEAVVEIARVEVGRRRSW
jgi:hypothetical protein